MNKTPNNNDFKHITDIMLNEAPNSNNAMRIENNVRLTAVGAQQFSMVVIWPSCRYANLSETRDNDTIRRKVCAHGNKLCLGKEWRLYTQ